MIGFARAQEDRIEEALASRGDAAVRWRRGEPSQADAWWVCGTRTRPLADGSLRIAPSEPGGRAVRLALPQVSRPIAFAEPLARRDFEPAYSFALDDPASMAAVLEVMETKWLASTAVRRWLAGRLIAAEDALTHRIYHLLRGDALLGVVDRAEAIGWSPEATIADLAEASWIGLPPNARDIPQSFQRATISDLVWDYVLRAEFDLLPARYRSDRIYFRRPPRVAPGQIGDEHVRVMRELAVRAASFDELLERTGFGPDPLARALAALYFTGSITSNPRRAGQEAPSPACSAASSLWAPSREGSPFGPAAARTSRSTTPASLPK